MYLNNFSVLYVEDSKVLQEYVKDLLKNIVKDIFIADDGKAGIEMVSKHRPDIIISDINMPGIDGLQMSKIIKKSHETPIILLTSLDNISSLKKAIEVGIDAFVVKPIKNEELLDKLETIAKTLHQKLEYQKMKELENQREKIELMLNLLSEIGHHWRQPLSVILTLATGYEIKQEMKLLEKGEDIKMMNTISTEIEKLANVLESIQKVDLNTMDGEDIKKLVSISQNPIFK